MLLPEVAVSALLCVSNENGPDSGFYYWLCRQAGGYLVETGGYLDLEGGNRICMVLEWTLGLKRPG